MDTPKQIAPVSAKMQKTMSKYTKKRKAFLALYPFCQAKLIDCTLIASDVHHKAGRGEKHNDMSTWLAVCRSCHQYIENNPEHAKELGLSESRLKTEES